MIKQMTKLPQDTQKKIFPVSVEYAHSNTTHCRTYMRLPDFTWYGS